MPNIVPHLKLTHEGARLMLDAAVIFKPETLVRWLRRIVRCYACYYNKVRTHLSLNKDTPVHRPSQRLGRITSIALLGGLHHQYAWI